MALTCSSILAAECVVNSENYPNPLKTGRKLSTYINTTFGVTKEDFPGVLKQKFDAFCQSQGQQGVCLGKRIFFWVNLTVNPSSVHALLIFCQWCD